MAEHELTPGWMATTERAESSYGQPVYVADRCPHGTDVAHSLPEAIGCGLLAAVRAARGLSMEAAAAQIGTTARTIWRWEHAATTLSDLHLARALETWLLETG